MKPEEKERLLKLLGERLGVLKKQSNRSYRELALRCDLDFADIKKYEEGKKDIQFSTIIELSKAYGVNPKKIFDIDFGIDFGDMENHT
ncbi:helix-turn-helix domain-containing protein [Echinicola shivajiensis]|uniref:helix-turn-helix domain-containing protein n=1 Tax=Echinicola shivajiensis TaxID=1035916 RepID=UPI001BFC3EEC|nr:helix-turn-helix transcriptional regulator [Echinicola shivajiensis]